MKNIRLLRRGLPILGVSLLIGCATARLAIPPELETRSEVFPCLGRGGLAFGERFTFGPYEVFDVRRGWTRRATWSSARYERSQARQQYEFSLRTPAGRIWQGQGVTGMRTEDIKEYFPRGELTWGLSRAVSFVARLGTAGQTNAWTLALAEDRGGVVLNGSFTDGTASYRVEGTRQLAGSALPLMENAGFLVYDGPRLVAAIDLLNSGAVHFDQALPAGKREPLAAAAAALLLYRDLSRD